MGSYTHLGLDERRRLYQLTSAGRSPRQDAAELGRHPSTIYRELKRNHRFDEAPMFRGYFPLTAQSMAARRRLRSAKISRYPELASYVVDRLAAAWSPEQIAGYLRHLTARPLQVIHETIYQFVYGPDGQADKLARLLPTGRWKRRRRYARKPRGLNIPLAVTIAALPSDIAERADFFIEKATSSHSSCITAKPTSPHWLNVEAASPCLRPTAAATRPASWKALSATSAPFPLPSVAPSRLTEAPSSPAMAASWRAWA